MRNHRGQRSLEILALFLPEIKELLEKKDFPQLKDFLKKVPSLDLAEGFKSLSLTEKILVFKLLSAQKAIELFENLRFEEQSLLLNNLANEEVSQVLNEMSADQRVKLFKDLPQRVVKRLFGMMRKEEVEDVRRLLSYREGTAGAFMTTDFIELKKELTAKNAILRLQEGRKAGQAQQDIYSVYVTDDEHRLTGTLSLQELLLAAPDMPIRDLMSPAELIKITHDMPREEVAKWFSKYDLLDVPVVDEADRLLGIITIDDIVDVIQQEATEDIAKMAGTKAEDIAARSTFRIARLRLPWLITTLIGELVVSVIIKHYEFTLSKIVALASFLPLIAAMGGNVGAQSATIVVRSLATGHIQQKDMARTVFKEFRVGVLLGVCYGIVLAVMAFSLYGDRFELFFPIVVGLGMCTSMIVASTAGAAEPFVLSRFGVDPATATGPLITTTTDLVSTSAYLVLATWILL
ncbi:MAG: magnesium transporter [Candidatus Omnitrophica bacterium]|nr:magnesium transporter [Candidatus Omnitrophota bacterium]